MRFKQLRIEAWKSQDFKGVWTCDLVIPVQRSNQLSYEATDVRSWSFVSSSEPVKNGYFWKWPILKQPCDRELVLWAASNQHCLTEGT